MSDESSSSDSDMKVESIDGDFVPKCEPESEISHDCFESKSIEPIIIPEIRHPEEFQKKSQLCKILEIHKENCRNNQELTDFLKALSELHVRKDVIAASIQFEDDFGNFGMNEMEELADLFKNQSIVIHLASRRSFNSSIYWKSKELNYFLMLKSFEEANLGGDEEFYKFIAEFLARSLKVGHLGLSTSCQLTANRNIIDIKDIVDARNFNLLLLACEAGKLNIAVYLCKLGISFKVTDQNITAQDLALKNGHYDLIQALYEENLPLPIPSSDMDMDLYPGKFIDFIMLLEDFFRAIEVDDLEKVKEVYKNLPKTRHIFNFSGQSAIQFAVVNKALKSYEFLLTHKHTFAPNEDPEDFYEELEYQEQFTIREIHNRHAQESPKNHINVLMTKSYIVHDVPDVEQKLKIVRRAYRILNRNVYIRIILMIVAASKNFKIIFDFHRESINVADPTVGSNIQGMFYTSGRIYIGAKQLLDDVRSHETLAIIAHELCHFAINLVYGNNAKPYKSNDNQSMQEFEEISDHCKANYDKEEIIKMVYEFYPSDVYHAELIVRVVHLMAFYYNEPQKLKEVREDFDPLFDFFELKVVPELKEALPEIEKRVDQETKIKDQKIVKFRKFSVITGLLALLGVLGAALIGVLFYIPDYKFELLSEVDQSVVMNAKVVYKDVEVRFDQLFPKGSIAYERLTSEHIYKVLKGSKLDFCDPHFHYLDELVVHSSRDMAVNLQDKVLSSDLTFQNQSIKFEDLHELAPKSFNFLTSNEIIQILNGNEIKVGKMIKNRTEFYLERIFWNEDLLDIYKIYTKQTQNYLDWEDEGKFRQFFNDFTTQNLTDYFHKIDNHKKFNQIKLFFAVRTDNSFNVLQTFKSFHENFEIVFKNSQKSKIFILSSEAGTGKTINFEQFAMKIKRKFRTKWVTYVDLKDYTKLYTEDRLTKDVQKLVKTDNYTQSIDPQELLSKILNLTSKSDFEQQLFKELYNSGQVVLLWNGFDEISPTYNKFILNLLASIHKTTTNIQFICTRPLYSRQLAEHLNILPYTIVPFTIDQQTDFLNKFFISKKIKLNNVQNFTKKAHKIIETIKAKTSIVKVSQEFNTPLMLEMIADLITSNSQIYNSENLYEIYENFIKKKIEIWRKKSEFAAEFLGKSIIEHHNFDMIKMYQMFALKKELKSISPLTQIVAGKLRIMRQKMPKNLTSEEISRMGILYINGKNEFEFSHKTFAEFFVAQFFIENILNADNVDAEDVVVILHSFEYFTEFYGLDQVMVTNFMFSYLEGRGGVLVNSGSQESKRIVGQKPISRKNQESKMIESLEYINIKDLESPGSKRLHPRSSWSQESKDNDRFEPKIREILRTKFARIFFNLLRNKRIENFRFLFEFFKKDQNLLKQLLKVDENETINTAAFNCAYFPDQIDSFDRESLKEFGKIYLNNEDYERFVKGRDQKGVILYSLYVFYKQDVGKTGQRKVYHENYDLGLNLLENDDNMQVFEEIVKNLTRSEVTELLVSSSSPITYKDFKLINNSKFWNISQSVLSVEDQKVLISNIFYGISRFNDPEPYLPYLFANSLDILSNLEIHNIFKSRNILHRGILSFDSFWSFFVNQTTENQQKKILTSKIVGECYYYYLYSPNHKCFFYPPFNIFHISLLIQHPNNLETLKTFNSVKETYEKYFSKSEMQNMILESNDFMIYTRLGSYDVAKAFVEYLKELFKGHEEMLKEFLLKKIIPTNFNIFEYFDNIGVDESSLNVQLFVDLLDYVEKL
ncbi:hypothetical protein ACKWTF_014721 [Chironomus riparius]